MTPSKAIETIDRLRPNAYDEETKFGWINNFDGNVMRLVIQDSFTPYNYPADMDKELLIPAPFEELYVMYLEAMIDYHNREYQNYNNTAAMFETRYSDYKKAYIREHAAKG